jgi:hypothetical protein
MLPVSRKLLPVFFLLYWSASAGVLWWAYDISPLIRGGYYERHQALVLVTKMGLIVTVLTSFVWSFILIRKKSSNPQRAAWNAAWQTTLFLCGYAAVILARLQFGDFGTPLPDRAFLPIIGTVNSHFFSEAGGLSFLLSVAPIMGCVSGILYFAAVRLDLSKS